MSEGSVSSDRIVANNVDKLMCLMGDFTNPVPLIQVIGLPFTGKTILIESFLKDSNAPYSVIDCSVFTESSSLLIEWKWSKFIKDLIKSITAADGTDEKIYSKLSTHVIQTPCDLVSFIAKLIEKESIKPVFRERKKAEDRTPRSSRRKSLGFVPARYKRASNGANTLTGRLKRSEEPGKSATVNESNPCSVENGYNCDSDEPQPICEANDTPMKNVNDTNRPRKRNIDKLDHPTNALLTDTHEINIGPLSFDVKGNEYKADFLSCTEKSLLTGWSSVLSDLPTDELDNIRDNYEKAPAKRGPRRRRGVKDVLPCAVESPSSTLPDISPEDLALLSEAIPRNISEIKGKLLGGTEDVDAGGVLKCITIVIDNYHHLLTYDPVFFSTLLKFHERLTSPIRELREFKRKVTIIFVGHYPIPNEILNSNLYVPIVKLDILNKDSIFDLINKNCKEQSISIAYGFFICNGKGRGSLVFPTKNSPFYFTEVTNTSTGSTKLVEGGEENTPSADTSEAYLPLDNIDPAALTLDDLSELWDVYVNYVLSIVFKWYRNDLRSLYLYIQMVWILYMELLSKEHDIYSVKKFIENDTNMTKSIDFYTRIMMRNYQTRFIAELQNAANITSTIKKPKFNGSRLAKYIIIGATIATFYNPRYFKRQIKSTPKKQKIDDKDIKELWNRRNNFDMNIWITLTEWLIITTGAKNMSIDTLFYQELLWVIDEGYIRPVSEIKDSKTLPIGTSGLLWTYHSDVPSMHNSSSYLSQLLRQNVQFFLFISQVMVESICSDLALDIYEYIL